MSLLRRVALAVNDLHAISVLYLLLLSTFVSDLALVCSVLAAGVMHGHGKCAAFVALSATNRG